MHLTMHSLLKDICTYMQHYANYGKDYGIQSNVINQNPAGPVNATLLQHEMQVILLQLHEKNRF